MTEAVSAERKLDFTSKSVWKMASRLRSPTAQSPIEPTPLHARTTDTSCLKTKPVHTNSQMLPHELRNTSRCLGRMGYANKDLKISERGSIKMGNRVTVRQYGA